MKAQFIEIIKNYFDIRTNHDFKNNGLIDLEFNKLVTQINKILSNIKITNFKIEYSYGKGQWAIIPWLAILDETITSNVSEGVYVVYLFSSDSNSVFLTLNQGTGGINRANTNEKHEKIIKSYDKALLRDSGFNYGPIPSGILDKKKRMRPKAYENACIYWKQYSLSEINKISEIQLQSDLIDLTKYYFLDSNNQKKDIIFIKNMDFNNELFINNIRESGLLYSKQILSRFVSSLITKPFAILSGLSGSGKTKLAQAFAQWICQDDSQYCIIPVGADWTNREPLLGYPNALKPDVYIKPDNGALELIIQATKNPDLPYFLILDEMNLSIVERYFADFLSVMESKDEISLFAEETVNNGVPAKLSLPSNLFIIGTVNIDETTYMFSPKVLDRANAIEFRVTKDDIEHYFRNSKEVDMTLLKTKGASMAKNFLSLAQNTIFEEKDITRTQKTFVDFFEQLKKTGAEFGYRSASEILRLINQLGVIDSKLTENEKVDIAIIQKLLPKLHGSRRKLCPVLIILAGFCVTDKVKNVEKEVFTADYFKYSNKENVKYPLSLEKITRMFNGATDNGFASFAEA